MAAPRALGSQMERLIANVGGSPAEHPVPSKYATAEQMERLIAAIGSEGIEGAVNAWLADHPEATTTVEDGAITKAKLTATLKEEIEAATSDISTIKSDYSKKADIAPVFSTSSSYKAGDYVFYNGSLYCFTADHAAGAWTGTDASAAKIANDVRDLKSASSYEQLLTSAYTDIIQGTYSANSTEPNKWASSSTRVRTNDMIPVYPGMQIIFTPGSNAQQMLYGKFNSSKVWVQDVTWTSEKTVIKVNWTGYIICVFRKSSNNENISASDYDATLIFQSKTSAEFDTVQNEIGDINSKLNTYLLDVEVSPNLYNSATDTEGVQLANAGYTFASEYYNTSDYIDISGVTPYAWFRVAEGNQSIRVCYYDSGKTNIANSTQSITETAGSLTQIALTVPNNAKYIRFHYNNVYVTQIYIGKYLDPFAYVSYGATVTVLPSEETKEARGTYPTLGDRLDSMIAVPSVVEYWGDSLTQGNQDSTGKSRPGYMADLLGSSWTVENYGVGGEQSNAISARASGIFAVISAGITIPADGSAVDLTENLTDIFGNAITFGNGIYSNSYAAWPTVNPCKVNGTECILQKANSSSPVTIKLKTAGSAIAITRPTYIVMNSTTFDKNPVLLICAGQNEGFNRDADELISQIDGIINERGSDRFIVFGMPHSLYNYTWQAAINAKLKMHYGKNYYDIEAYMKTPVYSGDTIVSSYALQDAELTPTSADLTAIGNNQYPPSIMFDGIHFNQYGYKVWANREYLIGKWLGYWE